MAASASEIDSSQITYIFLQNKSLMKGSTALATKVIKEKAYNRRKILVVDTSTASL